MCTVSNFKAYGSIQALNQALGDRWVYIGRANSYAGLPKSPLANPFKIKDLSGRGQTLPPGSTLVHYRCWLWQHIQAGDEAVLDALRAIDASSVLICWCKPGPCHGDVVKAAAAWLGNQRTIYSGNRIVGLFTAVIWLQVTAVLHFYSPVSTKKEQVLMIAHRLFNLVSRLTFSRWARGYEEHHGACEDAYAARLGPLHLAVNRCYVLDHDDAGLSVRIPTPWGRLHLGYVVCLCKDEIRRPGFYTHWLKRLPKVGYGQGNDSPAD